MAGPVLRIEGLDDLKRRLTQLATKDADRMMNNALRAGATVFQVEEESRAPERPNLPSDTALPPGALKRDVTVKRLRGKKPVWVIGPGKYTQQAAHLVELGHRLVRGGKNRVKKGTNIQQGPGEVVGHVPPHPYIRPAFEAGQQTAMDAIAESLQADLARMDNKAARKGRT